MSKLLLGPGKLGCFDDSGSRLTTGRVMVFDQFNHELAPGETRANQGIHA
jgi:hypothetical protein